MTTYHLKTLKDIKNIKDISDYSGYVPIDNQLEFNLENKFTN